MAKRKAADDLHLKSLADMGEFFGVSRSAAEEWHASGGAPKKTGKGYSVRAWARWIAKRKPTASDTTEAEAKRRRLTAQASREELKLECEQGKLITRDEHTRVLGIVVHHFINICERAPAELAPKVAGRSAAEAMKAVDEWFIKERLQLAASAEPKQT